MAPNNLLRVTQMNAIYLDKEINKSFQQLLRDCTKYLPPGLTAPYENEINLLLRLAILNNSVWNTNSTFGQQLLGIQYANMSPVKKVFYVLFNCLDYVKTKLEIWKPSHELNNIVLKLYLFLKMLEFLNLSVFLRHGVRPLLTERVLRLDQVYTNENSQRTFESKYLARELLWSGFIEMLVYILPLINYHKLKRTIRHYNPMHKKSTHTVLAKSSITMHSKCAYCGETPLLPHHMGCVHIFCYVCLKGNQTADPRYECPICEHKNPNTLCERVSVA